MFRNLGNTVSAFWPYLLIGWGLLVFGLIAAAPDWDDVVQDGEFAFLPQDTPSRQGEQLFEEAFSKDLLGSTLVIVLRRESHPEGLQEQDRQFIDEVLKPRLEQIAYEAGGLATEQSVAPTFDEDAFEQKPSDNSNRKSIIANIRTFSDRAIGHLLQSADKKASLVFVELTTEFLDKSNRETIAKVEELIGPNGELRRHRLIPPGLDLAISGSATVGRDMVQAAEDSASATELWTVILVLTLLIVIYRAPLLAIIPLVTVAMAVAISLSLLAFLADAGWVSLFSGIEIYVTVILYGAGVDYCLFLIARYKEELDSGASYDEAVANSLTKVGAALTASAGTVMCGIGMMVFAEFGKFQQAGVSITLSLCVCLAAALTFTPSLLRLTGRWAFWPRIPTERIAATSGWISTTSLMAKLMERDWFRAGWTKVGRTLLAKPGTVWLASIAVMVPFAVIGVLCYDNLSYGLLSELPDSKPSVVGTKAVQTHFPAGVTGPLTILLENPKVDFSRTTGIVEVEELTKRLIERKDELGVADVRSVSHPLGGEESLSTISPFRWKIIGRQAVDYYVSRKGPLKDHVTRIDVVFEDDPFSRNSIQEFVAFQQAVKAVLNDELQESRLFYIGPTPSIHDLKRITDRDQVRIDLLVLAGVFLILVILLRKPAISAYLIISVFFSYLVTLGVTFALFWALDPEGFSGLDWKVPMFLFTILIAVGEDYNIFLMTRIEEEQQRHGTVDGIVVALQKTGSIISSCGFIMAGTFSSLLAGSLVGMHQLGFALAFGVLLDTFVVRPILVPAYLILLHRGRFGVLSRFLGAQNDFGAEAATDRLSPEDAPAPLEAPSPVEVGREGSLAD